MQRRERHGEENYIVEALGYGGGFGLEEIAGDGAVGEGGLLRHFLVGWNKGGDDRALQQSAHRDMERMFLDMIRGRTVVDVAVQEAAW